MKAIVTGGAGFIGSHLVDYLLERGHEVTVIDNMSGGDMRNLPKRIDLVCHSLGSSALDFVKMTLEGCEVLYHLAADATEGRSQFTPYRCTMEGLAASAQAFAAAAAVGVKRIVFTSSMAVYGDQPAPFTEEMEPKPVDVYGVNKHAAERMLQILAETHGFEYVILRPHNIYGPRQNPMDRYRNVVTIFISRVLRGLPMQIYGDGKQVRAFTWIGDVIGQIAEAGWRPEVANQVFNVGSDTALPVEVLAGMVSSVMFEPGLLPRPDREYLPGRPREVHAAYCDNSKWWRVTGDARPPETPWRVGLAAVEEWMRRIGVEEPPLMELEIPSDKVPEPWRK